MPEITTTLIVLTLNEIDGCRAIMPRVKREWVDRILFIDGGSTDGTVEWIRENGYDLYLQEKPGIRGGYRSVWDSIKSDVVITFSPDGNCIPEKIPELVEKMKEGYDLVIASRYLNEANSDDDDIVTGFGNWLFTKTVNIFLGGKFTDVLGIFRAYRRDYVKEIGAYDEKNFDWIERLLGISPGELCWDPFISARTAKYRRRAGEIAASEPARLGGERKLKVFKWGGAVLFQFLREIFSGRDPNVSERQRDET
ncbi:MAG: histidinol phosphate phosphatase [Rhodospirillales bacterium RIFCSPLOWO2_12_FULL_58_28]|nr:MAG: histidinol phosphate phosphatase [Rhodospirillales bacterium RIFCSPLOWO2_02_FULL_58_16]OHC79401.1 MAG: histidinol phosphate phosphatase [Rhodospirillales bacterium RIFCSPLOWO2_12_FULL_58_28]